MIGEHVTNRTDQVTLEDAVGTLERLVDRYDSPAEIPAALQQVRTALTRHCDAMEKTRDVFDEFILETPRLSHHVAELKIEHAAIRAMIDALLDTFGGAPSVHHPALLVSLIGNARVLCEHIQRHHQHTADVMHEAFVADTGWSD